MIGSRHARQLRLALAMLENASNNPGPGSSSSSAARSAGNSPTSIGSASSRNVCAVTNRHIAYSPRHKHKNMPICRQILTIKPDQTDLLSRPVQPVQKGDFIRGK